MLFAVSDSILTILCLAVIGVMNAMVAYLQARTKAAVEKANDDANLIAMKTATRLDEVRNLSKVERAVIAEKVEEQSKALAENTAITKVVEQRVNGDSAGKDRLLMLAMKRIYELTGQQADKEIADEAERVYQVNMARQATADKKENGT